MARLDTLLEKYKRTITAPWATNIAAPQRIIFVVYDPSDELKLRARLGEFELATVEANHSWKLLDISDFPARWIISHEYREQYFKDPDALMRDDKGDVQGFTGNLVETVKSEAKSFSDPNGVFAICGVGSLFGFSHVSGLVDATKAYVSGRYVVFFPGDFRDGSYRLLDARDGWNYLALSVVADEP